METRESHEPQTVTPVPPRRPFRWVTAGLATVAAAIVSAPVLAYVLRTRKSPVQWIDLGTVSDFPENQTRRMTFDNPIRQPWDGIVAHAAVYVRNEGTDQSGNARFLVLGVNCAPRLPSELVSGIGPLHVSLPRRRLLLRRQPGLWSPAARIVSMSVARPQRKARDSSAPLSDPARHVGGTGLIGRQPVKETEMPFWRRRAEWIDRRLALRESVMPILRHPIPRSVDGPMGWWYVFGSASMTLLGIQFLTGIGLALVYVPSADKAYDSLVYLNDTEPLGWFLRALHYYAGSGMVVLVLAHMTQVFLQGAYKYPREMTWVLGVCLLLCTLGMFFTGQVLRWDPDAYWGLAVGSSMAGRVPGAGPWMVRLLLGGPVIGGDSLSRFFALHVFVIPGLLIGALVVHLWLILKWGVSEPPRPGAVVDPRTYDAEYEETLQKNGVPFLGDAALKDVFASAVAVIAVVALATVLGPKGPTGPPDPTLPGANPRPEWPFFWLFALLSLSPPALETLVMLVFPVLLVVGIISRSVREQSGRAGPESPAGGRAFGRCDLHRARHSDLRGKLGPVVTRDDRLERGADPGRDRQKQHALGLARRGRVSK